MPPLVMPWPVRKLSSVCAKTSKIALPMASTSYFAVVIHQVLLRQLRGFWEFRQGSADDPRGAAAYHDRPMASKHSPLPHGEERVPAAPCAAGRASRTI